MPFQTPAVHLRMRTRSLIGQNSRRFWLEEDESVNIKVSQAHLASINPSLNTVPWLRPYVPRLEAVRLCRQSQTWWNTTWVALLWVSREEIEGNREVKPTMCIKYEPILYQIVIMPRKSFVSQVLVCRSWFSGFSSFSQGFNGLSNI